MAGKSGGTARLLEKVRPKIVKELDINKVLPRLLRRGVFSVSEEKEILVPPSPQQRTEVLLDILSRKDRNVFIDFCQTLEECAPKLLTHFVLENQDNTTSGPEENPPTQALQLGFELALKERDAVLRDNAVAVEERDEALRQVSLMKAELEKHHRKSDKEELRVNLENPKGASSPAGNNSNNNNNNNNTTNPNNNNNNKPQRTMSGRKGRHESLQQHQASVMESDQAYEENGPNVVWETHHVTLHKAPTFGFGIAVSGGHGSPHFANGDPSVAISDVLKAGPAEGKLQINDRILSVNGFSLENVDHTTAINVLRDCGNSVNMVVKRRVILPGASAERNSLPSKIILSKKNKKDDYGVILGCQFFVKEILPHSLASHERTLHQGDNILKINNTPVEGLSLTEAKRMLEKSKDKLMLLVSAPVQPTRSPPQPQQDEMRAQVWLNNSSQPGEYPTNRRQVPEDVNVYRPSVRSEEDLYVKDPRSLSQQQQLQQQQIPLPPPPPPVQGDPHYPSRHQPVPPGAYPDSQNTRYDGHYVLDNDLPPRNLLPGRDLDPRDGYHSDWDDPSRGRRRDRDYEEDVFPSPPRIHDLEPRKVVFTKDKHTGLGLRLAGGNATGIYIASVQAGSEAEREGLVEGDNILVANEKEITGLTREEAVSYLTSLNGQVTMVVQYKKEDYDCIMASHEAGDSFYIRVHFNHQVGDSPTEHSFQSGDTFLVKDTLFRGVGGSWLSIRVTDDLQQAKKGTMPNNATAEKLKAQQKGDNNQKEAFPNRGKGSLFRKKSARRSKSLGKDHWEEVVFDDEEPANLETKFPAYERVVMQDPGFVRPVVIFGAIADIARDRLLAEYPDKFDSPQIESDGDKKGKTAIIRLGAIRDAINKGKHCLLDVTPSTVDRLQYGQYCPLVIFLQPQSRQGVKDVRTRWKGAGGGKNARKLQEHGEKLERNYAHMFTGVIHHMGTDAWFPKLYDMIETQQSQPCWMSCKLPQEDMNEEFMFPMSPRFSYAAGADSDVELPRPRDDFDLKPSSATLKPRLVRSSSDPSVNTMENIPGIPPYPSPPTYKNQRIPSHDSRVSSQDVSPRPYRDDELMHPEDRYYPSYYSDHNADPRSYAASRAHIDPYATLTPSEKLRPRIEPDRFHGDYRDYYGDRGGNYPAYPPGVASPNLSWNRDYPVLPDNLSQSSDSYTKYVSSPQNKHDDTKLREKFAHLNSTGSDRGKSHDPYRFTRSTAHPVSSATVDRAKLSDLSAKYRRQENQLKPKGPAPSVTDTPPQLPIKKKEPPPVPVKTYSLKQRGPISTEPDERKMRNYENSNRAYNYTDINTASAAAGGGGGTPPLPPPPSAASLLGHHHQHHHPHYNSTPALEEDQTYEYMSLRNAQQNNNNNSLSKSGLVPQSPSSVLHQRGGVFDANNTSSHHSTNNLNSPPPPSPHRHNISASSSSAITTTTGSMVNNIPVDSGHLDNGKAFANEVYMDTWDLGRARSSVDVRGGGGGDGGRGGMTEGGRSEEYLAGMGYRRPRTDDEQIRDLQISRERARSESRFPEYSQQHQQQPDHYGNSRGAGASSAINSHNDIGGGGGRSGRSGRDRTRYKSLDGGMRGVVELAVDDNGSSSGQNVGAANGGGGGGGRMFDAYKKLVTPGLFSAVKSKNAGKGRGRGGLSKFRSQSQNALDDRSPQVDPFHDPSQSDSAFNAYQRNSLTSADPNQGQGQTGPLVRTGASELRKPLMISPKKPKAPTPPTSTPSPPPPPPPPLSPPSSSLLPTESKEEDINIDSKEEPSSKPASSPVPTNGPAQSNSPQLVNGTVHSGSEGGSDTPPTPDTVIGCDDRQNAVAPSMQEDSEGDERHTVIATAKGIFNVKGGLLESPETGVSIWIPEGALGEDNQEIYFKVCQDNSLLPPLDTEKGETLLSPLVMCGPHGTTFNKPVHLRLPHSASSNPESWSFALKSSDAPSGETTEWQNVTLAGSEGVARGRVDQSSVSIMVDHF